MRGVFFSGFLLCSCSVVSPGEKGIRVSFGEAKSSALEPGFYFSLPPIFYIKHLDLRVQKSIIKTSAASKDMQEITTEIAVNWQLESSKLLQTFINIGDEQVIYTNILLPAVSEVLKSEMSQLTGEEILTKRASLKASIDVALKKRLENYGVLPLDVSIVNLTFSQEFTKAIEEKQIAEQSAKKAEYTAQKAIKEADATVNHARGQAEAQRLMEHTLTPAILQRMAIEKWDGKLPQYMTQGSSVPFLKLGEK